MDLPTVCQTKSGTGNRQTVRHAAALESKRGQQAPVQRQTREGSAIV